MFSAVQSEEPLDWAKFRKALLDKEVTPSTIDAYFKPIRVGSGTYTVEVVDLQGYQALVNHLGVEVDKTSRAAAALHGRSHAVPVSGNLVIVQSMLSSAPVVYECDSSGQWTYPVPPGKELVLVENLQNFLERAGLLTFLGDRCGLTLPSEGVDMAYAVGNAITKTCNKRWLSQYERIHCVFDIDPGGFRIYESLRRMLAAGGTPLTFVVPNDLDALLEKTHRFLSESDREALAKHLSGESPLRSLAVTLLKAGKTLEQESYIYD
ncbi:hypothetical protein A3709_20320 [Halioglobus sp. HI00S01]|nr:hypothetical protein A3709_20320 [Halioglobus sp. HI00S01]